MRRADWNDGAGEPIAIATSHVFPLCKLKQLFLPAIYPVRSDVAPIHHSCSALSKLLDAMPGFEDNARANVLAFEIIE